MQANRETAREALGDQLTDERDEPVPRSVRWAFGCLWCPESPFAS